LASRWATTAFSERSVDFDTQNQTAFLVMELITGPTLAERLTSGALEEREDRA
jgi:hypothetical protein